MKKIAILLIVICLLIPTMSFAAGSVTATRTKIDVAFMAGRGIQKVVISWTADAADGTVPSTSLNTALAASGGIVPLVGWSCYMAVTDPGATAPTDDYDIVLNDEYGADIFGTAINDRDTTSTEQAFPIVATGTYRSRLVTGNLTFGLSNNAVNSAVGQCILYFILE